MYNLDWDGDLPPDWLRVQLDNWSDNAVILRSCSGDHFESQSQEFPYFEANCVRCDHVNSVFDTQPHSISGVYCYNYYSSRSSDSNFQANDASLFKSDSLDSKCHYWYFLHRFCSIPPDNRKILCDLGRWLCRAIGIRRSYSRAERAVKCACSKFSKKMV